jgi:hypothetical protein
MFDAHLVGIESISLRIVSRMPYLLNELRIASLSIAHVERLPHAKAIAWRWKWFTEFASAAT